MALHAAKIPQLETPTLRRFNADEYFRMAEAGILKENEHLELIDGVILQKYTLPDKRLFTVDEYYPVNAFSRNPNALPDKRLFTVDEYYRMAEAGILKHDERVELIAGEIIKMAPIGISHNSTVLKINSMFTTLFSEHTIISIQSPLQFDNNMQPEPDVMLLRYKDHYYSDSLPTPEDVHLIIEVSETTLRYDRDVKLPLYAKAGIPEVWIIDIDANAIEKYANLIEGNYVNHNTVKIDDTIYVDAFPNIQIETRSILLQKNK